MIGSRRNLTNVAATPPALVLPRPHWFAFRGALVYGLGILLAVVIAFPVLWMCLGAFRSEREFHIYPMALLPAYPTFDNFRLLWTDFNFPLYFWNSTWLSLTRAAMNAFTSALCGYVLAKVAFRGRGVVFVGLLATMMLPSAITLIPSYLLMMHLRLLNTYWAVLIPGIYSAYGTFLMRQLMVGLPEETLNAGRIDGASEWGLFWNIALPAMLPGATAVFILSFMGAWGDFTWPLMVLSDSSHWTLPIGLASLVGQRTTYFGPLIAGSALATLPLVLVFYAGQRYITESGLFAGLRA